MVVICAYAQAFVPMTHVNSSAFTLPPYPYEPPSPPRTPCEPSAWLRGAAALQVGTGRELGC